MRALVQSLVFLEPRLVPSDKSISMAKRKNIRLALEIKTMSIPHSDDSTAHSKRSVRATPGFKHASKIPAAKPERSFWVQIPITVLLFRVVATLVALWTCASSAALLGASATSELRGRDTDVLPTVDLGYTVQQATSFNVGQLFHLSILIMSSSATD